MGGATLPALPPRPAAGAVANATLIDRIGLTEDVALLRVEVDAGTPRFRPGQYLALGVMVDGRLIRRPYSAASSADGGEPLLFLIRRVPQGALTPRLWALRPGARIHVGPPKGLFTLLPDDERDHLFVATGTGLAPFISMLREMRGSDRHRRVVVVHGVAHAAELAFRSWLEPMRDCGVAYHPVVSRPWLASNAGWSGATGRVDAVLAGGLPAIGLQARSTVAYLCGSPGMIAEAVPLLRRLGLDPDSIRCEEYWSSARDRVA